MTREELIEHLEHLEKYTHYSEDAPALREVIEILKCSEMPNSSDKRTQKRTETHACDLPQSTMGQVNDTVQSTSDCISRQAAIDIVVFECGEWTGLAKEISKQLSQLSSTQPDIIRCRDCKHWNQATAYHGAALSFGFCESDAMWRTLYGETTEIAHIGTDDDFFCGYAERREE